MPDDRFEISRRPDWKNKRGRLAALRVPLLFVLLMLIAAGLPTGARAQVGPRCFPETGFCITGRFRSYWEQNGGLPVFGFPITPEQVQTIEGQQLLVQSFERNRFELHQENLPPYDVLLGRLDVDSLAVQGRDWMTFPKGDPSASHYFAATGHAVPSPFWEYWSRYGLEFDRRPGKSYAESLALFGLPLSEATIEVNPTNGQPYLTQHFERARFELHPENNPPYNVLLGLLGSELRDQSNLSPIPPPAGRILYFDADGSTIKSVRPDGSDSRTLLTITRRADDEVIHLSADSTGTYLLYGLYNQRGGAQYYLVANGEVKPIAAFAGTPRWASKIAAFVARAYGDQGVSIYDVTTDRSIRLPIAGDADWFLDGTHLVYVAANDSAPDIQANNLYSYDIQAQTSTRLTHLPSTGDAAWVIQEAHVLRDGQHILFFGGQINQLGASGNGQQWWWIPASGGEPRPFEQPGGNGISAFTVSPGGDVVAYAQSTHGSACISAGSIVARSTNVQGGFSASPYLPEFANSGDRYVYVKGLSWSPDNNYLAFAIQPYTCPTASAPQLGDNTVYVWGIRGGNTVRNSTPVQLARGMYPVWTK